MIHYLIQRAQAFTVDEYLGLWGRDLASILRVQQYEMLREQEAFTPGAFIVSGMDQLGRAARQLVRLLARALEQHHGARVLNHPDRALERAALLGQLFDTGLNAFRAVSPASDLTELRYPVFLRRASLHDGPRSGLLRSPRSVEAAIGWQALRGEPIDDLLITEYLDTSVDGYFRKYAAFAVDGHIMARSLSFGRHWMRKHHGSEFTRAMVEEELDYVTSNPHVAQLKEIVRVAGIEYGRIDYALLDGRVQTWEINLNPTIGRGLRPSSGQVPASLEPVRSETKRLFYRAFGAAFAALATQSATAQSAGASTQSVVVALPASPLRAAHTELQQSALSGGRGASRAWRLAERLLVPSLTGALAVIGRRASLESPADGQP